jgi:hypothetical protein
MNCARCSVWSPEYRENCPFCKHAFPRSLAVARSRAKLKAERAREERDASHAVEQEKPSVDRLSFVQRRDRNLLRAHLGSECVFRETGIIAHCLLVSVMCQTSFVEIGLRNLHSPGFADDRIPTSDFSVGTAWKCLRHSRIEISCYSWAIRLEPEYLSALKRAASTTSRFARFGERFNALTSTERALLRARLGDLRS